MYDAQRSIEPFLHVHLGSLDLSLDLIELPVVVSIFSIVKTDVIMLGLQVITS